jgi:death-on-curing protein
MPFNTARGSRQGRPRPSARRGGIGIIGLRTSHCSSVRSIVDTLHLQVVEDILALIYEIASIHALAIEAFGGLSGVRDGGALEAALIAAENRAYYEQASLITCAATYAYHLTQAHAFLDGNKRVAAAVAEIFLELNRAELRATDDQS